MPSGELRRVAPENARGGSPEIYDRILPNAAIPTLVALLIGLYTVVVLDIALRLLRDSLTTQAAVAKAFRGRVRAFATLLHADPARHVFGPWLTSLRARVHHNVAVIALANKLARIAWAVLVRQEPYRGIAPATI